MTNRHGGARAGAGRRRGGQNQATRDANEAAKLLHYEDDPAAWLTALMIDNRQAMRLRIRAAKILRPYSHERMSPVIPSAAA